MDEQEKISAPSVGGSSLLVIFAVLCLTTFALLGLASVQADIRLSDASLEAVKNYYNADWAAEELFARLREGEIPEEAVPLGNGAYSFACPISETQTLQAELQYEGGQWTVLRWQAVYSADWEADQSLNLWDGTLP